MVFLQVRRRRKQDGESDQILREFIEDVEVCSCQENDGGSVGGCVVVVVVV